MPDQNAVRRHLEEIVASPTFRKSERLAMLLRFTVEWTLDGRASELKEVVIGTEVFERPLGYDPKLDSVVRTSVNRLRLKLHEYYSTATGHDLRIQYPKGSYAPRFEEVPVAAAAELRAQSVGNSRRRVGILAAALLACAALTVGVWLRHTPVPQVRSVAVLSFANLTGKESLAHLGEGVAEEVIDSLARLDGLKISARTSSFAFRDGTAGIDEIARKLGVESVMEGSIRLSGDTLRLTAQLNRASDGFHIWSVTVDAPVGDVFRAQERLARAVVEKVWPGAVVRPKSAPHDPQTLARYQEALALWSTHSLGIRPVRLRLEEIIANDPSFAPAYTLLAEAQLLRASNAPLSMAEIDAAVKPLLERAAVLDANLADLHCARGRYASVILWDWKAAEESFLRAIQLSPGTARFHGQYGFHLALMRRYPEAIRHLERAKELDPLRAMTVADLARALYMARRYDEAIAMARQAIELDSKDTNGWVVIALSTLQQKRFAEAFAALEAARSELINFQALLGHALGIAGRRDEAQRILRDLETRAKKEYVQPTVLARLHLGLGEYGKVEDLLERAFAERDWWLTFCIQDPRFDVIRNRPRVQQVIAKLKIS